jgi:S-methylmethionine-dependent homocysteine/selenocysteine methylase
LNFGFVSLMPPLRQLFLSSPVVILDGALGSELESRGVDTRLPLWSAGALISAPAEVQHLHEDYLRAGADIIATCTFRTTSRTFSHAGLPDQSERLTALAVRLAMQARDTTGRTDALVGGSIGPLEDCYRPDLAPSDADIRREQSEQIRRLVHAGVDILLLETMSTIREAAIAAEAAAASGREFMVSFLGGEDGRLFSGEKVDDAVGAVSCYSPSVIAINCAAPRHLDPLLYKLRNAVAKIPDADRPLVGAYANTGRIGGDPTCPIVCDIPPDAYVVQAKQWAKMGVRLIGGCCGTNPAHIAALRQAFPPTPLSDI